MEEGRECEDLDQRKLVEPGNAYSAQGMWKAVASYTRSLALRQAGVDTRGQDIVLNSLGAVYYDRELWREALDCYQESRQIVRELEDEVCKPATLMNLAVLHFTVGQGLGVPAPCRRGGDACLDFGGMGASVQTELAARAARPVRLCDLQAGTDSLRPTKLDTPQERERRR